MPSLLWFRRDLRLSDNPALNEAVARSDDGRVIGLFVLDPRVWDAAGPVRQTYLRNSLRALDESLGGKLLIVRGVPEDVVPRVVATARATSVHFAADFGVYGAARDERVKQALDCDVVITGSPYAVAPGRVRKDDGTPYRVYTPFYRAWVKHGWRKPAGVPKPPFEWWSPKKSDAFPRIASIGKLALPEAGEEAAWNRWNDFRENKLSEYADLRNRADLDGTSILSHHLKFGEIHPRSLLAELDDSEGAETYRKELAWREFYADVLHQRPDSVTTSLDARYDTLLPWDTGAAADRAFAAWQSGQTGFPFVDAGMRQLRETGWMHNRVRMVVASFLVKDLHLPWQRGAAEFMQWLRDGDVASNQHGWQWTAGCGTDASPYYRIFNPITQGLKFDPDGDYVRRYIPELRHLPGKSAHEPWNALDGYAHGYPEPIVDHKAEREEALRRFALMKQA